MEQWGMLVENIPIAAALIWITKLWLAFLEGRDKKTLETFKAITKSINENTKVLAELKTTIEHRVRNGEGIWVK